MAKQKSKFDITAQEIIFVVAIGLMGFLFTTKFFLVWLNSMNPLVGFFVYYAILYAVWWLFSLNGIKLWEVKIEKPMQLLGLTLLTFSFFAVVNWENPYVQYGATGSFGNVSNIYFGSEDGALWYVWSLLIQPTSPLMIQILRVVALIISPIVIAFIGVFLVTKEVKVDGGI